MDSELPLYARAAVLIGRVKDLVPLSVPYSFLIQKQKDIQNLLTVATGVEWTRVRKMYVFQRKLATSQKRREIRPRLQLITNRKWHKPCLIR